jgi:hypothetical protein
MNSVGNLASSIYFKDFLPLKVFFKKAKAVIKGDSPSPSKSMARTKDLKFLLMVLAIFS